MGKPGNKPEKREKRKYERDEPVSLAPLDFREALSALLQVKPDAKSAEKQAPAKRSGSDS